MSMTSYLLNGFWIYRKMFAAIFFIGWLFEIDFILRLSLKYDFYCGNTVLSVTNRDGKVGKCRVHYSPIQHKGNEALVFSDWQTSIPYSKSHFYKVNHKYLSFKNSFKIY